MYMHSLSRSFLVRMLLVISAALMSSQSPDGSPGATAVHPLFDLSTPDKTLFPSDQFTVAENRNLSRRRVNLPKPADCTANKSECEDLDVLNQLDGFSLRPRVTIPFDGEIDPATVQGNVFFIRSTAQAIDGIERQFSQRSGLPDIPMPRDRTISLH